MRVCMNIFLRSYLVYSVSNSALAKLRKTGDCVDVAIVSSSTMGAYSETDMGKMSGISMRV